MRRRDFWDAVILATAGAIALLIFCGSAARANEPDITVFEVTRAELDSKAQSYGEKRGLGRVGFSVLGKLNGKPTCYVYVLDKHDTGTLEHELRHCHGWVHE